MRLIEVSYPEHCHDRMMKAVAESDPTSHSLTKTSGDDGWLLKVFLGRGNTQDFVDRVQGICGDGQDWRILVLPVEATVPALESDEETKEVSPRVALREEIYEDVARGAEPGPDFFLLTLASTIVAAVGMSANSVAAVIGAMVIAPLLGPILAFSFATALGDTKMLVKSARSAIAGLVVGTLSAILIGLAMPINLESPELVSRTIVGVDSVFLALAAGAAAALSISTGVSSALVGVMVAVALLPPAAAMGLYAGSGELDLSVRAGFLLVVNVICIMLSAQAVYQYKGIRPRTWLERRSASHAVRNNLIVLAALLGLAVTIMLIWQTGALPSR